MTSTKNMGAKHFPISAIPLTCLVIIAWNFSKAVGSDSEPKLASHEVEALKVIGKELGMKDWNFRVDPCSGEGNWNLTDRIGFESSVACNCSLDANTTTCHVVSLQLKAQNLTGQLPVELYKLRYLHTLDLSRNILTGTIPSKWATMSLVDLSLMGNRLSGPFPLVLTNITTLRNVSIESNQFRGSVPPEIANLINLIKLTLSSNQFSGKLPAEMAKLTNLTDLRLCDNNFSGNIPDFVGNWTNIEKLHIQGSSLNGPIPSSISELTRLSDLRISDLTGSASNFPQLKKMNRMRTLILRNCLIHGSIPEYIGEMEKLKTLDLSFNNLTGPVPDSFTNLDKVDFMYFTGNMLTGAIPGWIIKRNKNVDISYNNFTSDNSSPTECSEGGTVNIVESYSPAANNIRRIHSCLKRDFPCDGSPFYHSLHINCGGRETIVNGTKYEADVESRGASLFYSGQDWALSSTGNFMDNDIDADEYTETNTSVITNVSGHSLELYRTARVSPLALTYYGLCLLTGNYTVKLHFAEIIFKNGSSFDSLGKRMFDVYIQGKLVLKDFNIENEAGTTSKPLMKTFTALVERNTLVIHFYWAGKGTQGIPNRGVYGPLISAISVEPNFKAPIDHKNAPIKLLVGVLAPSSFLIILITYFLRRKGWLGGKVSADSNLKSLDTQIGSFSLRQIKAATKNFNVENKIGEGGFGSVYKGLLSDGTVVAVKQLSSKSKQGSREFVNEIGMISALQHPNLVKLHGCCVEGNQLLVVYEYMENNCLSRALFGRDETQRLKLNWPTRHKICLGIARGLAYLHEESILKIVHRDIKTSNVLLDKDLNAKISDFGLAKLHEEGDTHISTRVAGTIGYMAPEYAMRGYLTAKADVYSFGVVALEIVSGKSNTNHRPMEECVYLLDWACVLQERGCMLEMVDPSLGSEFCAEEAMVMLNVALLCTNASPTLRPTMSQVVSMLEGRTDVQDLLADPGFSTINPKIKAFRKHFWETPSQTDSMSKTGPYTSWSKTGPYTSWSIPNTDKDESKHLLRVRSLGSL